MRLLDSMDTVEALDLLKVNINQTGQILNSIELANFIFSCQLFRYDFIQFSYRLASVTLKPSNSGNNLPA